MSRWVSRLREERGNVLATVVFMLGIMFAFSGIAIDLGRVFATKSELQRALDAGSLAGAAELRFNGTVFPVATSKAESWSNRNHFTGGTPDVSWSSDNTGDVKLGVWSNSSWAPWDGTATGSTQSADYVNAVRCTYSVEVPTAFLGLIGWPTLRVSAMSTAWSAPPMSPGINPTAPFGLPPCSFISGGSQGCGSLIAVDAAAGAGNAVWSNINPSDTNADANTLNSQLTAAANWTPGTPPPSNLVAGADLSINTGAVTSVMDNLAAWNHAQQRCPNSSSCYFPIKYAASSPITVTNNQGSPTYTGKGWKVVVPILDLPCGGGNIPSNVEYRISTFAWFLIVQVINSGYCTVNNPNGVNGSAPWIPLCQDNGGTAVTRDETLNRVYGVYMCDVIDSGGVTSGPPVPRAAVGTTMKLVQ